MARRCPGELVQYGRYREKHRRCCSGRPIIVSVSESPPRHLSLLIRPNWIGHVLFRRSTALPSCYPSLLSRPPFSRGSPRCTGERCPGDAPPTFPFQYIPSIAGSYPKSLFSSDGLGEGAKVERRAGKGPRGMERGCPCRAPIKRDTFR